jgi:hypothetical protein
MMLVGILTGVILSVGFIGGAIGLKKYRARMQEFDRRIREYDLLLLRAKPNFIFSLGNISDTRGTHISSPASQYEWIRYDLRHGLFEVHPDVIKWCDELAPGYVVENDEQSGEMILAFANENDRFHFKMRWL